MNNKSLAVAGLFSSPLITQINTDFKMVWLQETVQINELIFNTLILKGLKIVHTLYKDNFYFQN